MKKNRLIMRWIVVLTLLMMLFLTGCRANETTPDVTNADKEQKAEKEAEKEAANADKEQEVEKNEQDTVQAAAAISPETNSGENFDIMPEPFSEAYLFPGSDSRELDEQDIIGYDSILLQTGVNEIYARHGYTFKDKAWQTYFMSKDWYKPSDAFNEAMLSSIEKNNIAFLQSTDPQLSTDFILIDINQDGEMDTVETEGKTLYSRIRFGNDYCGDPLAEAYTGTLVTDLDINDGKLELLVFDSGPSADYTITVCTVDEGVQYTSIGNFPDTYFRYEIDGKGNASFETFHNMLYCLGDYVFEEGELALVRINYPTFTLAKDTSFLKKGEVVTLKIILPEDYNGSHYLVHLNSVEDPSIVDMYDVPEDFTVLIDFLSSYFNEIGYMYYGD